MDLLSYGSDVDEGSESSESTFSTLGTSADEFYGAPIDDSDDSCSASDSIEHSLTSEDGENDTDDTPADMSVRPRGRPWEPVEKFKARADGPSLATKLAAMRRGVHKQGNYHEDPKNLDLGAAGMAVLSDLESPPVLRRPRKRPRLSQATKLRLNTLKVSPSSGSTKQKAKVKTEANARAVIEIQELKMLNNRLSKRFNSQSEDIEELKTLTRHLSEQCNSQHRDIQQLWGENFSLRQHIDYRESQRFTSYDGKLEAMSSSLSLQSNASSAQQGHLNTLDRIISMKFDNTGEEILKIKDSIKDLQQRLEEVLNQEKSVSERISGLRSDIIRHDLKLTNMLSFDWQRFGTLNDFMAAITDQVHNVHDTALQELRSEFDQLKLRIDAPVSQLGAAVDAAELTQFMAHAARKDQEITELVTTTQKLSKELEKHNLETMANVDALKAEIANSACLVEARKHETGALVADPFKMIGTTASMNQEQRLQLDELRAAINSLSEFKNDLTTTAAKHDQLEQVMRAVQREQICVREQACQVHTGLEELKHEYEKDQERNDRVANEFDFDMILLGKELESTQKEATTTIAAVKDELKESIDSLDRKHKIAKDEADSDIKTLKADVETMTSRFRCSAKESSLMKISLNDVLRKIESLEQDSIAKEHGTDRSEQPLGAPLASAAQRIGGGRISPFTTSEQRFAASQQMSGTPSEAHSQEFKRVSGAVHVDRDCGRSNDRVGEDGAGAPEVRSLSTTTPNVVTVGTERRERPSYVPPHLRNGNVSSTSAPPGFLAASLMRANSNKGTTPSV